MDALASDPAAQSQLPDIGRRRTALGPGEIVTALLGGGMTLTEHRGIPWEMLPGLMTPGDDAEWRLGGD